MHSLKFLSIFLSLLCFVIITTTRAQPSYFARSCPGKSVFPRSSTREQNLFSVLSSLSSGATFTTGFNVTTAGEDPYKVYGLFLCRQDVSIDVCKQCVAFATKDIIQLCNLKSEAVAWYDDCLLHYADHNIFTSMDLNVDSYKTSSDNGTYEVLFDDQAVKALNATALVASKSPRRFAAKECSGDLQTSSLNHEVYCLMQCTLNLSPGDCFLCLQQAINQLPHRRKKFPSGRVLYPYCYFRYEPSQFYNAIPGTSTPSSVPLPPSSSPPPFPLHLPSPPSIQIPRPGTRGSKFTWVIVVVACVIGLAISYAVWRRKNKKKEDEINQETHLTRSGGVMTGDDRHREKIKKEEQAEAHGIGSIRLEDIEKATQNFSHNNFLGRGGFGLVYKGKLEDGQEIAVKRLNADSGPGQGLKQFMSEVSASIAKVEHKNLVRLLGYCQEKNEKLLIYEYLPNKSLDLFIFDRCKRAELDWPRRLNIIHGIAMGLLHLHDGPSGRIIHRDLKPSNILLDLEMNPKISDFGMAKIFYGDQNKTTTGLIPGTPGYLAPECMRGFFSAKSDVFSFGVIVLEIISGRRNNEHGEDLLALAWNLWSNNQVPQLMEKLPLESSLEAEVLKRIIHIALLSVQPNPDDRPSIFSIVEMLSNIATPTSQPLAPLPYCLPA